MNRTLSADTPKKVGEIVKLNGWVNARRNMGKIVFLDLRDRWGIVQVVCVPSETDEPSRDALKDIRPEFVLEIEGVVQDRNEEQVNEKLETGKIEVLAKKIKIFSAVSSELPIAVVEKNTEEADLQKRLDWRWIDLRKPKNILIFKVWTLMEQAFREYWTSNDYIEIHSPKFMGAPSEGSAELFEVKYFDRKAYLAQSPQFYKQMAMASGFEKVFEVGPVFRANPSFTPRHDTEFTGYDMEISFIESHQDIINEEQKAIQYVLGKIKEKFGEEILSVFGRDLIVPTIPFPQITMKQAKEILAKLKVPDEREGDLSPEEERKLSDYIKEKEGYEFVFVTEYPVNVRPFYHMRLEGDQKITKSFDLLWNGLEITTGAQREHRYNVLVAQAKEKGLKLKLIQFYLNFFKYGCPPHGGLGLGPSRMLMKIFNIDNVREVTYLYRGIKRLEP
ncbi:aspartate--tRNA(Asn) ligase [Candidatus Kuenenbacteria bacterium CG10_big_fil_rev_8_21_14_0_10_36_11]|uniref:Aspartate--tRNA ligase n=1 Tax=Candidatus Kuenenbacteria bacterium CG10_big_fil_rev_8_21_14_0_10_36_11 TaxID=1974618 RepID=A0A2M6WAQ2_9BACT|nr:MAG: aspartate--tRNA(Asn) ligase [Candidatus Kuenenbacteria bacterium CG10_big_fil_rev_8_21_14_0_10_36_11]